MALFAIVIVVNAVNASSILMEVSASDRNFAPWEPFVWEATSGLAVLSMVPLVHWAYRRWPPFPPRWQLLGGHLLTTIAFTLGHVAVMWPLRALIYRLVGGFYEWGGQGYPFEFLYEWRKDVLIYTLILLLFWGEQRLRQPAPSTVPLEPLLSFRTGGGLLHLRPSEIRLVEAAGNYVEIESGDRRHLVRMTLASTAEMLGDDFVQVHRSRLVNRSMIRAEKPQPSGDVQLDLTDGTAVMASRRFRARLPSAGLATVTKAS